MFLGEIIGCVGFGVFDGLLGNFVKNGVRREGVVKVDWIICVYCKILKL